MRILAQLILGLMGAPCAVAAVVGLRLLAYQLLQQHRDEPSDIFIAIVLPVAAVFGIFYGVFLGAQLHDWYRPDNKEVVLRFRVRHLLIATTLIAVVLGAITIMS